jgi:protein-L-isoaspartate(D-aspartate) O-methyltransferase
MTDHAPMIADPDPVALRRRMVDEVTAHKYVIPWADAFTPWVPSLLAVPRHMFIPTTVWTFDPEPDGDGPQFVPLHRDQDPDRWLQLAYELDGGLVTQVDDGNPVGPGGGGQLPTSSASDPSVMAVMLAALNAKPGHRVLEIGTGTGYNAALLAHRLGCDHVTTVEIDPMVADRARLALRSTGHRSVHCVIGDGEGGYPPRAPYDRVIATGGAYRIPYSWVAQTAPGGRVLVPWANSYGGGLLALDVTGDGTAHGRIVAKASFMALRAQRDRGAARPEGSSIRGRHEETTVTTVHPHDVTGTHGARVAIGQHVPGCRWRYYPWTEADPVGVLWFLDPWGSSAKLTHESPDASDETFPVTQTGPRRLWDEIERAYAWWVGEGSPDADRWHFTVDRHGQQIELLD